MSAHSPTPPCQEGQAGPVAAFNLGRQSPESGGRESQSGPHRRTKSSSTAGSVSPVLDKEKRKRSRVTPEQLVHLERYFAAERSPTAARRKEISDYLGMQERQTQIWFQNRRAKAKNAETKGKVEETPPNTPPPLSNGNEPDLHEMLHEDHDITIIPCQALSVGTWRRVVSVDRGKRDLVAYICERKRSLTWFICSGGHGFKMEIAFDSVINSKFTNSEPGKGVASFVLSRSPNFYMESAVDGHSVAWKSTADWTEHQQATRVLQHDLAGPAMQLSHIMRHFQAIACGSEVHLAPAPVVVPSPRHAQSSGAALISEAYHAGQGRQSQFADARDTMPQPMSIPAIFGRATVPPSVRARGAQPMAGAFPLLPISSYATSTPAQYIAAPPPPLPTFDMTAAQGDMGRLLAEYGPLDSSSYYTSSSQPVSPYSVTPQSAASLSPTASYADEQRRVSSPILLTQPFYPRQSSLMPLSTTQSQANQTRPLPHPESPSGLPSMPSYYGGAYGGPYVPWS